MNDPGLLIITLFYEDLRVDFLVPELFLMSGWLLIVG